MNRIRDKKYKNQTHLYSSFENQVKARKITFEFFYYSEIKNF